MFTILGADGKEYGPVTAAHLHEWIRDGRANLETKARLGSEGGWKPLGSFPEFGGRAAAVAAGPRVVVANRPVEPPTVELASHWRRLLAAMVDGVLKVLCYLPITIPIVRSALADAESGQRRSLAEIFERTNQLMGEHIPDAAPFIVLLVLVQLCLLTWRGQSVGKLLLGIRIVVAADHSAPGLVRAFLLRGTLPFLVEQVPVFGMFFWLVDSSFIFREDRRCLHDLVAGTKVVRG